MDAAEPLRTRPGLDLDACAQEPIRSPGAIQPHGALLLVDPSSLTIMNASANAEAFIGDRGVGRRLDEVLGALGDLVPSLQEWQAGSDTIYLRTVTLGSRSVQVIGHLTRQGLILELEEPPQTEAETLEGLYPQIRAFFQRIEQGADVDALCRAAVRQVRAITGFNRVLAYRFDADWNGQVIAEDRDEVLPSYLDLRFPAADIPAQARELYRLNRLRLIPDASYTPVPVWPPHAADGEPLDLSLAGLRSVSPVHLEYMRNMGTGSSMSVSILVDGSLWGLISCHSAAPRRVNAQARTACDFLGQVLALQIGARERVDQAGERVRLKRIETELVAGLSSADDFRNGLADNPEAWMNLVEARGAAVLSEGEVRVVGYAPSTLHLRGLADWLQREGVTDTFVTDCLSAHWSEAESFADVASGLIAVSISTRQPSYLLWFRPEVVRTVAWGGDPTKPVAMDERLSPRKSFETWKEQVRGRSLPWTEAQVESARDFGRAVVNFVLQRAEERAELTEELQRANRELESFSYSISHDLRAPFRHIVGYAELLGDRTKNLDDKSRHYLTSIVEAALSAGRLVDDLLAFSQLGRSSLQMSRVDMRKLSEEVRRTLEPDIRGRLVEWRIGALPSAVGDGALLRQAFANLMGNAVKYTRGREPAVITVEGREDGDQLTYSVSDNGVGFDMAYVGKLFGVFQRLHRAEDFEGTGIGLALTKRIVERHGGRVQAQGVLGEGATFTFTLPNRSSGSRHG
jgi:light-regulated signal transduction histidine kinase (bacteriophytochrome)